MTVEMIVYGLLKIFIGLSILLVYLRLTHGSQAGPQTPIDTIGNFVIGGVLGGVLYSTQICHLHGVYAVHDSAAERGDHEDSFSAYGGA